jgi:hypothetical protein
MGARSYVSRANTAPWKQGNASDACRMAHDNLDFGISGSHEFRDIPCSARQQE